MKVTRLGPGRPLLTLAGATGGSSGVPGGFVPTADGSNGVSWGSNVATISANGSNYLLGPHVNFASGTGITLAVASNTMTITSTGGGSSLTVADEGTPLATAATTLDFVGAGVTATGTGATKTVTIPGGGAGGLTLVDVVQSTEATGSPASAMTWDATPAQTSLMVLIGQNNGNDYSSITQTNATWTSRYAENVGGVGNLFIWTGVWDGSGTIGTSVTLNGGSGGGSVFAVEVASTTYSGLGANGIYAQQLTTNIKTTTALKDVPAGRLVCFIVHGAGSPIASVALMSCPQVWCTVDAVGGLAFGFSTGAAITGYADAATNYYTLVDIVPA